MLTAHYNGSLGVTPPPRDPRTMTPQERGAYLYEQRQKRRMAQVKWGPFTFSSKGSTIRIPSSRQELSKSPLRGAALKVLKNWVTKTSAKYGAMSPMGNVYLKGWGRVTYGVMLGKTAIAKIKNPADPKGNWGLFVNLKSNKLEKVTFKKIPPSDWGFLGDIGSGIASVAGAVADGASAVGSAIASGVKAIPHAVGAVADMACSIVNNPTTQQAAALAAKTPSVYGQGAAIGVQIGAAICGGGKTSAPQLPIQPMVASVIQQPKPKTLAQRLPPGSIQTQVPGTNKWAYAIPKGSMITPLSGLGFVSIIQSQPGRRWSNWYDMNTADAPYRATWGFGAYEVVGTGDDKSPTATVVDPNTFSKKTTPFYKKWWFWLAVGGGILATGTTGYLVYRRRK